MRLSTVFELLLIFLFLAFAASRSIHEKKGVKGSGKQTQNRYCECSNLMCNCCRDFSLPVVALKGPGCAAVAYVNEDAMRLTMSFGDKVLRNITLAGKRPNPVCMPLPGGVSKFCGRVYGITKDGDHFKACLALELRSLEDLEAALRVSCFRFGPEGVKLEPGRPVPAIPTDEDEDEDDDDYGLGDDDDDDDDDDDFGLSDDDDDEEEEDEAENDVDSGDTDYTGFSALSDEFLASFFGTSTNKKPKPSPAQAVTPANLVRTTKLLPNKAAVSTKKTPIRKTTTPVSTVSYETTAKAMVTTKNKTFVNEMVTSSKPYAEVTERSGMTHETQTDIQMNESTTEMNDFHANEETEQEESDSTMTILENYTESPTSINNENKENNNVVSRIITDVSRIEDEDRASRSNRGHDLTPAETEKLFPGLTALIRPPSHIAYSFPPVRSARTHRRMRLPPIPN